MGNAHKDRLASVLLMAVEGDVPFPDVTKEHAISIIVRPMAAGNDALWTDAVSLPLVDQAYALAMVEGGDALLTDVTSQHSHRRSSALNMAEGKHVDTPAVPRWLEDALPIALLMVEV